MEEQVKTNLGENGAADKQDEEHIEMNVGENHAAADTITDGIQNCADNVHNGLQEEAEVKVSVKEPEKKRLFIIIGIVAAIVLIIGIVFLSGGTERKLQKQLDLGQKYIDELDYEQALASYLAAIEIDPMCAEAYIGAADAYIGMGDYENAEAVLEQGYEATADVEIEEKLAEVQVEIERIATEEEERREAEEEANAEDALEEADDGKIGDVNGDGKIVVGFIARSLNTSSSGVMQALSDGQTALYGMVEDGTIDDWTGFLDGNYDISQQDAFADDCISQNCDYVIIFPVDASEKSDSVVTKMADAGIQVIVVGYETPSTADKAMTYLTTDDVAVGEMMAQWVVDQCPDGGKYVHLQGTIGHPTQVKRGEGIANIMDANDKFECAGEIDCGWDNIKAFEAANLKIMNDAIAAICDSDSMSATAQKAFSGWGRTDIICIGADGDYTALEMVKSGEMEATVYIDTPTQVQEAIAQITHALNGEEVEKEVLVPPVLVTQENISEYYQ